MQQNQIQKLRSKILTTLGVTFVILLISVIFLLQIQQQNSLESYENTTRDAIHKAVDYTLKNAIDRYIASTSSISKYFDIKSYVTKNQREELYTVLKPKYDELQKENPHFKTMHFIKSDGTSFLRMHKKDKYGDDIASLRPMIRQILKDKEILVGYEAGLYATAFRVLVPIFDGETFLGSFGIGIDPNYLMEQISEILKQKGALFIKEGNLELFKGHKEYNLNIKDYILQTNLDKNTLDIFKSLPEDYNFEDQYTFKHNQKTYFITSIDVEDFEKTSQGKFLFIDDITNDVLQIERLRYFVMISALLFISLVYFILRRYFLKYDRELNDNYSRIINDLESSQAYSQAIEDNSASIIISTFKDKICSANKLFFEFTGYSSLASFAKDHDCICDLFIARDGYVQTNNNGKFWIDYIIENPNTTHKVIMLKEGVEHIFKVTTSKVLINGNERYVSSFVDITDIEEIKNRLSYAVSGSKDGLWDWNIQTKEVYFAPRWKEMLGFSDDEIPNDLDEWSKRVHPDDYEKAIADIKANQENKTENYNNVHRLKHKDGHWVWIHDRGQTIFDESGKAMRMIGFHTDITNQMKEREHLNIQAKRAEALLELPKIAEKLDEKEFLQKAQEITEDLTGSQVAFIHFVNDNEETIELVAWSDRTLQHYCNMDVKENRYPVEKAGIWADPLRLRKPVVINDYPNYSKKLGMPEGHAHLERFISVPVIEKGKVVMLAGAGNKEEEYSSLDIDTVQLIANDIWQAIQRKRQSLQMEQKDKMMLAQSRNAAMGEMISMIAHQWRQPLAVISMVSNNILADIELDMIDEGELQKACEEIIGQTKELSTTIDDFKNFFKPQKYHTKVFISEVVEKTLIVVGKSLENNNISVKTSIATTRQIDTFSRELMQVLINIINNAKEALLEREVKDKTITIEAIEQKETLKITIEDSAGGIFLDDIYKVFEPYFSTKNEKNGTGLGLYMSKTIIEKHLLGTLDVYNTQKGALFEIEIPYTMKQNKKEVGKEDG